MSTSISSEPQWFALFTVPNHEKAIAKNLRKKGFEAFLPLRNEVRQWSDRKKRLELPLFPNYLFVKVSAKERFGVFEVPGIIRFLETNRNPQPVSEKELNLIRLLENEKFELVEQKFAAGDSVIITSGPLTDLTGKLIQEKGRERILVEISSIKRNLIVDVSRYQLTKFPLAPHLGLLRSYPSSARYNRIASISKIYKSHL